jgi:DNA polymerase-1
MPKKIKTDTPSAPSIELAPGMVLIQEGETDKLTMLCEILARNKHWSFDVETDGAHFILAKLDGIGFYIPEQEEKRCYINLYKCSKEWNDKVIAELKPHFENNVTGKIGHNIIYDSHVMKNYGVDVAGPIFDTMIACYLINPDDRPFRLKRLVPKHLKIEMREYKEIDRENITDMAVYCMEDAKCTYLLYKWCKESLLKNNLWRLFNDIEMPFLKVLLRMERRGIRVDVERLTKLRAEYESRLETLKLDFCEKMFGCRSDKVLIGVIKKPKGIPTKVEEPFNINSGKHLAALFFKVKKYPILSKTNGGKKGIPQPSTDKHALIRLYEGGYEGLDTLLEYRSLGVLLKNFIRPILDEHMIRGRVYPSFMQHGTRTGRLASSRPNFQNVPVRSKEGKEIRKCFIADEGYKIIDADLSQIELRVMAHFSHDPNLIKAYMNDLDLHDLAGQEVFGAAPGSTKLKENKDVRTLCKNLNFGLGYGAGAKKFAFMANIELRKQDEEEKEKGTFTKSHKISEEQAQEYINKYFKKFSGIRALQITYPKEVRKTGYATTILGRRRFLPNIYKKPYTGDKKIDKENWIKVSSAERQAVSTLIQGTASDVLKLAMIKADKLGLLLAVQIHDQLLAYSKIETAEKDAEILRDAMENCGLTFLVPIKAEIIIVEHWEQESEGAEVIEIEQVPDGGVGKASDEGETEVENEEEKT